MAVALLPPRKRPVSSTPLAQRPARSRGRRWLRRLLEDDANLTIDEAVLAAAALAALRGRSHVGGVSMLRFLLG